MTRFILLASILLCFVNLSSAQEVMSADDILNLRSVADISLSPDGNKIAYTLYIPRKANDTPGQGYQELYVVDVQTKQNRPFITGKVNITSPQWSPDGKKIAFKMKRGNNALTQIWAISLDGGEAWQLTKSSSNIDYFKWHPSGKKIVYISCPGVTAREKALKEKGYDFIYFEEEWKHKNLYLINTSNPEKAEQLTANITVWDFEFSNDGNYIAFSGSPKNLIDYRYMFRKIYLLDIEAKTFDVISQNKGKVGNYAFSPDDEYLAYTASFDRKDHQVSQAYLVSINDGDVTNLTPTDFAGHINWVGWQNSNTILYKANEGINVTLNQVDFEAGNRKVIFNSAKEGFVFSTILTNKNATRFALIGQTALHPNELFFWIPDSDAIRLTNSNPFLENRKLGRQEVMQYKARDGYVVEGLLVYPVDYKKGTKYPLIMQVHGGPESNYSNGWLSRYSSPAQVLAGKGYFVFYPNYRASTGYGLKHAAVGYNDPAGVEFDDLADAIDHLVNTGLVDKQRVGLGGGSYGGYASAWFATYYTEKVRAVCMFVGISDLISKRGTTDIPYEELYVHSGKKLEDMWQESLKHSPIFYAHKSKTATLIYGGTSDTRVHPSQSLELYRRMKMNNHPAVRLVQYPGEKHGNSKQPGRIDVIYRQLDWYDWYVRDLKPLDGPMPALDISEKYGLNLPE